MVVEYAEATGKIGFVPHDAVLRITTVDEYAKLMLEQSKFLHPLQLETRSYNHLVSVGVLSAEMKR
jgi:hypothetical protein